jgi:hypothetical protein
MIYAVGSCDGEFVISNITFRDKQIGFDLNFYLIPSNDGGL